MIFTGISRVFYFFNRLLDIEQSIRATEPNVSNPKIIAHCLAVIPVLIRRCRKLIHDELGKPIKPLKKRRSESTTGKQK
jgi:hypothetical protein